MSRKITESLRRKVEADFYKLLGRVPKKPAQTRDLVEELLLRGTSSKATARVACAADSDDPSVCAAEIADRPRVSVVRSKHPLFDGPPVFAKSSKTCCQHSEPPVPAMAMQKSLTLHVGQDDKGASVDWRGDEQTNAFLLITGGSGSGKSELLRSVAGQIGGSIPIVVFDVHGDLALPGFRSHPLGARLGINPLNQPAADIGQRVREFVSTMRTAVPGLGSRQQLLLSETAREVCRSDRCDLAELRKRLVDLQEAKSTADRSSLFGLLASMDVVFGEPVFEASHMLDPRELLTGAHRLDLTQLVRPAQVMVIETILRWLFEAIKAAGPVPTRGQLRVFGICDEAALLGGSEVLDLLFREARKFGMGMALASQLANDFGPALRANAGTIFTLRANSAAEVQRNAKELGINPNLVAKLTRPGQAIVRDASGIRSVQIERWPFKQPTLFPPDALAARPKSVSKQKKRTHEP